MPQALIHNAVILTRRWLIGGLVQGVGFRPFVARLAKRYKLGGWVRNQRDVVEIIAHGDSEQVLKFELALLSEAPTISQPVLLQSSDCDAECTDNFEIHDSSADQINHPHLLPDLSLCDACLQALNDPDNRRYRYPFIACSECGPRYTVLQSLPYGREHTTFHDFPMCPQCQNEYTDPTDRRYHAQTISCPTCGPQLRFHHYRETKTIEDNNAAIHACIQALRDGQIVAVKGIGGYHLLCDAYNNEAVDTLRQRKHRPAKPLAILYPWRGEDGLDAVRCDIEIIDALGAETLLHPQHPILLLPRKKNSRLAATIAPGLNEVGIMLPYSPLHHLIANEFGGPLVATSANISGEPVLYREQEVDHKLRNIADAALHHNRTILRPADDSVYRIIAKQARPIRLGRGIAPLELNLPWTTRQPILALGGHLKTTLTLAWDDRVVVSPHIGDLSSPASLDLLIQLSHELQNLYQVNPEIIVCDRHPGFTAHRWAETQNYQIETVLHHHAHASALMGEHGCKETALVFTWDGMGLGDDGTLWGGETLLGHPGTWQRVGSFRPWRLQGNDRAAHEPWRSAAALCWELGLPVNENKATRIVHQAWQQNLNCHQTSAIGRLFDAAAAILGLCDDASYEAQAAMLLEHTCNSFGNPVDLPIDQRNARLWRCDWHPLVTRLQDNKLTSAQRAADFHSSLAHNLLAQSQLARAKYGINLIGLSGGVFQNNRLTEETVSLLKTGGFHVLLHRSVPCNDGGLSFGQAIEVMHRSTP
ncbi:MAG: carbamoyltransferase HypF [Gammaproteobacteria bacterium]|nr:carbamoyltransferase HypF [Gammaproteobacteria bacterium]